MKSNFKNLVNLLNLTDTKKRYLIFLVFLIILSSLADILSLGLVIQYVGQLLNVQNNKSIFLFELYLLNSLP